MLEVNLLPWREHRRLRQTKLFKRLLISAVFLAFVCLGDIHFVLVSRLNRLDSRIADLKQQIKYWHSQQPNSLKNETSAMHSVKRIIVESAAAKNVFAVLQKAQLKNVCFIEIKRAKNIINFKGQARSAIDFLRFLNNFQALQLHAAVNIQELSQQNGVFSFQFRAVEKSAL